MNLKSILRQRILLFLASLLIINACIFIAQSTQFWLAQIAVFAGVVLVPGVALFSLLKPKLSLLATTLFSFGLGILLLMIGGLLLNQLFALLQIDRPLELINIWIMWNCITALLVGVTCFVRRKDPVAFNVPTLAKPDIILFLFSVVVPTLAAFGAFRLNNGGDALVAMMAIAVLVLMILGMFVWRTRLSDTALAWGVFVVGLSLLLMTSLRSWDITGHDFTREFHVYAIVHNFASWDVGHYRDPYSACLSITILPEVFAQLMNIPGVVVFKVVLQVIFAMCPAVIYMFARRFTSKLGALVACGLFISYPTFINDSAMLTRQGIAFFFFALALFAALQLPGKKVPRVLFLLCSLGAIVSHYSTAYMFVALFVVALFAKWLLQKISKKQFSGKSWSVINPVIVAILALTTFLWYSQITAVSGGLAKTLSQSVQNIPHLLSDDNKSTDTSAALFFSNQTTQVDLYESYVAESQVRDKALNAKYEPSLASDSLPLTSLGKRLESFGIDTSITTTLRQYFAKILQILAITGTVFAVFIYVRSKKPALPADLVGLSIAGIVVAVCMVVLPNVSVDYGILRVFQQTLIFLVVPIVLFLAFIVHKINPRIKASLATIGVVVLLLLFTGFIGQLLGGVGAGLNLNNKGLYYGLYYSTKSDQQTLAWMKNNINHRSDVRAASFAKARMHDPEYPFYKTGILPIQRPPKSYVFLDHAQQVRQLFYVYHESSPLITTFPLNYYQEQTNKIYSTGRTGVYR